MATLYVTEFAYPARFTGVAAQPYVATQAVTISGVSAQSVAFNANTSLVRIHTDAICSVVFGVAPTATTAEARLGVGQTEYFSIVPGQKVAVISNV